MLPVDTRRQILRALNEDLGRCIDRLKEYSRIATRSNSRVQA